jgi:hypothetical protein
LPARQHSKAVGQVASMQWVAGKCFVQLSQMALTAQEVEIQHTLRVRAEPGTVDLYDQRASSFLFPPGKLCSSRFALTRTFVCCTINSLS